MKSLALLILLHLSLYSFEKSEDEININYIKHQNFNTVLYSLVNELSLDGFTFLYKVNIGKNLKKLSLSLKKTSPYINAYKIGFCKKSLSLNILKENPKNIIYCPMSLAIYEVKKDEIIIVYRKAQKLKRKDSLLLEVNKRIAFLIEEALE